VLCFFVKASSSEISQIVDLEGSSCSLNTSPQNYYYSYRGNTSTQEYTRTVIYHTANLNLTTDASVSAFASMFSTNLTTTSLAIAQTDFSINFISKSTFLGNFQPTTAMTSATASFQPRPSFLLSSYLPSTHTVTLSGLATNVPATAYFILASYKNITTNQITSKTTITIKPLSAPSEDQIASCKDGSGFAAVQCRRVAMLVGQSYSFAWGNLADNSVYAMYYTYANQYPQRPIFYGGVHSQLIFTTSHHPHLLLALALLLSLLMF
jgi:hypothetical protein